MKNKSMSNHPLRVALVYLVFSTAWIFITGYMVFSTGTESVTAFVAELGKGMLFVLLSTLLIYSVGLISYRWEKKSRALLEEVDRIFTYSPAVGAILRDTTPITIVMVTENINRFGYSREEVVSQPDFLVTLVHPDDFEELSNQVHQFIEYGEKEFASEFRAVTKGGEVRWVLTHFTINEKDEQERNLISSVMIDITEKKLAEQELREGSKNWRPVNVSCAT